MFGRKLILFGADASGRDSELKRGFARSDRHAGVAVAAEALKLQISGNRSKFALGK